MNEMLPDFRRWLTDNGGTLDYMVNHIHDRTGINKWRIIQILRGEASATKQEGVEIALVLGVSNQKAWELLGLVEAPGVNEIAYEYGREVARREWLGQGYGSDLDFNESDRRCQWLHGKLIMMDAYVDNEFTVLKDEVRPSYLKGLNRE